MIAAAVLAVLGALAAWGLPRSDTVPPDERPVLGLFTSLPIYWAEAADIAEALDGSASQHWARTALETRYRFALVDALEPGDLAPLRRLVMAQPRPLAPAENVALDNWVRRGGRLLLVADPMLTEESRFMIGDKRRPQDVVLLSPIMKRWGLELRYDESQPEVVRFVAADGVSIPVHLAGSLAIVDAGARSTCTIGSDGLTAQCRIGEGRVSVVADAAFLETASGDGDAPGALRAIVERAVN